MPTYEYACSDCNHHWEEVQKISEPALEVCPSCAKSSAKRQISGGNFILKGGGWYADLYSSSPKKKAGGESAEGGKSAEAKGETKSEPKSEKKADGGASAPAAKSDGASSSSSSSSTPSSK
jgi:putative FmdB family regulatory protein